MNKHLETLAPQSNYKMVFENNGNNKKIHYNVPLSLLNEQATFLFEEKGSAVERCTYVKL